MNGEVKALRARVKELEEMVDEVVANWWWWKYQWDSADDVGERLDLADGVAHTVWRRMVPDAEKRGVPALGLDEVAGGEDLPEGYRLTSEDHGYGAVHFNPESHWKRDGPEEPPKPKITLRGRGRRIRQLERKRNQ